MIWSGPADGARQRSGEWIRAGATARGADCGSVRDGSAGLDGTERYHPQMAHQRSRNGNAVFDSCHETMRRV